MSIWDDIQEKLAELAEIDQVLDQVSDVMRDSHSTQEDFDRAIQDGTRVLEEIEDRRK